MLDGSPFRVVIFSPRENFDMLLSAGTGSLSERHEPLSVNPLLCHIKSSNQLQDGRGSVIIAAKIQFSQGIQNAAETTG